MIDERLLASKYFQKDVYKSAIYADAVQIADQLQTHSEGKVPEKLLTTSRPNEEPKYQQYRKQVYKPVTKASFAKVVNTFAKIGRAEDWSIKYEHAKENGLKEYCETEYPLYDSVENWFFSLGLKRMVDDPNAVGLVVPKEMPEVDNEFLSPSVLIFESDQVLDYQEGRFVALLDREKSMVQVGDTEKPEGNIFHFADRDEYKVARQTGIKDSFTYEITTLQYPGNYCPAFKFGGKVKKEIGGQILYESFVSDCLADWDEAVSRYSDHQVNMNLHLHPKEWGMRDTPCQAKGCNGGKVQERGYDNKLHSSNCKVCDGTGRVSVESPFGKIIVNPANKTSMNENAPVVTPPGGYITRPIESISFLKTEFRDCLKAGLAAINMEFLMNEPELNSGVAKAFDRQEMNTFFYGIARHIVENILNPVYEFINDWRYGYALSEEQREALLPTINVPSKFDLISAEVASQRLATAKDKKFDTAVIARLESDYAKREFGDDCLEAQIIEVSASLDPLPNTTVDEKMSALASEMCSQLDAVLSVGLHKYITRAMNENDNFLELGQPKQLTIVEGYAQEDLDKMKPQVVPLVSTSGEASTGLPANKLAQTASALDAQLKIAAAVAKGEYSLDAAVALLSNRLGISEEQARRELGNPVAAAQTVQTPTLADGVAA